MDVKKPKHLWQLSFEGAWPTSVAFLGGSRRIAAGNRDGQIFIWNLPANVPEAAGQKEPPSWQPALRLDGHTNGVTHLIALDGGKRLISSSLDRTIRIWDLAAMPSLRETVVLDAKARETRARGKSAAEREKLLGAPGAEVGVIAPSHTLTGHRDWIKALNLSGDGRRLISGDDSCLTIVWDVATWKPVARWTGYELVWVRSVALSPDGKTAFVAEHADRRSSFDAPAAQARLWNVDDATVKLDVLKVWTPKVKDEDRMDSYGYARTWGELMKRGLICADYSPDGALIAAGQGGETDTGKVHLIDANDGKIIRTVSGHRYGVCDLQFSRDGKYILSSGRDTTVRICQVADGKEVTALGTSRGGQFKDWIHGLDISPDQQHVAGADIAGMIHVWQVNAS